MNDNQPEFFYGTAWKEDLTESCVFEALKAGFRAVDTANQRKHYFEAGAGAGLARGYEELGLKRGDLFLQSKFTYARGQDHRKPYDENAPFAEQVAQSFAGTLQNLRTDYLDSYILHGHFGAGVEAADLEVWAAMEKLVDTGKVRLLGVSNTSLEQLRELFARVRIKPAFVQNRCYAEKQWDKPIRDFCRANGIRYEGFSLLTANSRFLGGEVERPSDRTIPQLQLAEGGRARGELHPKVQEIVDQTGKTISQVVFRFCRQSGIIPVTGTRSTAHMKLDLAIQGFQLNDPQMDVMRNIAFL